MRLPHLCNHFWRPVCLHRERENALLSINYALRYFFLHEKRHSARLHFSGQKLSDNFASDVVRNICSQHIVVQSKPFRSDITNVGAYDFQFLGRNVFGKCFVQFLYQFFIFLDRHDRPECQQFFREHAFARADFKCRLSRVWRGSTREFCRRPRMNQKMLPKPRPLPFRHACTINYQLTTGNYRITSSSSMSDRFRCTRSTSRASISSRNSEPIAYSREPYFMRSRACTR